MLFPAVQQLFITSVINNSIKIFEISFNVSLRWYLYSSVDNKAFMTNSSIIKIKKVAQIIYSWTKFYYITH